MKPHLLNYLFRVRPTLKNTLQKVAVATSTVSHSTVSQTSSEEEGMTLLEALVAIVVLTIVLGSIAVPVAITVGSRVQNREVEQAQQIAQFFAEQTHLEMSLVSTWTYSGTTASITNATPTLSYSPIGAIPPLPTVSYSTVASVPAPTATCGITGPNYSASCAANALFGYDLDKDGAADFYVQTFRVSDVRAPSNEVLGFDMGVRVYPLDSIDELGNLTTERRSLGFTSGIGDPTEPIATLYTSLYRSEESEALVGLNACTVVNVMGANSTSAISTITSSPADRDTKFSYSLVDNGDADDEVIEQDPAAGTVVLCGQEIKITY